MLLRTGSGGMRLRTAGVVEDKDAQTSEAFVGGNQFQFEGPSGQTEICGKEITGAEKEIHVEASCGG